jgi:AcrR family transcriptional regulator
MPRKRQEQQHETNRNEILEIARRHMAEGGAAALSMRSIAAEMDMTAPALYRYFTNRDAIITELILAAYNALADAMEAGRDNQPADDYYGQITAVLTAYRSWARAHPVDFALIYGNPIPGYHAPAELTIAAARRGFEIVASIIGDAMAAEQFAPSPDYQAIPPETAAYLTELIQHEGYSIPLLALYLTVVGWARIHGILMLELFEHIQPVIGDVGAFYQHEVHNTLIQLGFKPNA